MRRSPTRLLLGAVVLPHELAHAAPARLAGLDVEIAVLPEWDGPEIPLGRFDAELDEGTPPWLIRAVAVAPAPTYLGLAAAVGPFVPLNSPAGLFALPALTYWASLSAGDLAVAAAPRAAREAGGFVVPRVGWSDAAAFVFLVLDALLVTALLAR
jgi:hypothetical protein